MAMTLRPTDGLVSRLLQQQTRHTSANISPHSSPAIKADQVNISDQARSQVQANPFKQQELESQLLRLYSHHAKDS
jgi:hypothetical protein